MAHLYAKDPPAFAKDPWAWDYTRDRMEQNIGRPYDEWEGRHFAGAAAMYKNVINKYGPSVQNGSMTAPQVCVDCGNMAQHYENDFICKDCRDKIENTDSYYEAQDTITRPDAIEEIRQQLAEKLGHKSKDGNRNASMPVDAKTAILMEDESPASTGKVSRNYRAMGDDKLLRAIKELEEESGEAVRKAQAAGEDVMDHLESALRVAQEKGLS